MLNVNTFHKRVISVLLGKICVHEVQATVLTLPGPHIGVRPRGEATEVCEHLQDIIFLYKNLPFGSKIEILTNLLRGDDCRARQERCKVRHRSLNMMKVILLLNHSNKAHLSCD